VDEAIDAAGESVISGIRVPSDLVDEFEKELAKLDPPAIVPGSFRTNEIERCRQGIKEFESLEKNISCSTSTSAAFQGSTKLLCMTIFGKCGEMRQAFPNVSRVQL